MPVEPPLHSDHLALVAPWIIRELVERSFNAFRSPCSPFSRSTLVLKSLRHSPAAWLHPWLRCDWGNGEREASRTSEYGDGRRRRVDSVPLLEREDGEDDRENREGGGRLASRDNRSQRNTHKTPSPNHRTHSTCNCMHGDTRTTIIASERTHIYRQTSCRRGMPVLTLQ